MRGSCVVGVIILVIGAGGVRQCPAQQAYDPFAARTGPAAGRQYGVIASVEFVDAPITTVFKMISDLTGWSIVMSPEVSAKPPKINIWIKNLTPQQVLDQVAALGGLVLDRDGTTVKVMTFGEYCRIFGVSKHVLTLSHADPKQLAELLKPFVNKDDQARIVPDEAGRKIVLLLPEPLLASVIKLVEAMDVPYLQDSVKIIALEHTEAAQITQALEQFLTQSTTGGKTSESTVKAGQGAVGRPWILRFMAEPDLNLILLRGSAADVQKAQAIIAELDVPSGIEVVSYELKFTNADEVFTTLKDILQTKGDRRSADDRHRRLRFSLSLQNNRIVVEGSTKDHQRLSRIIEAIDRPLTGAAGGIRVYRLENASSSEVARVIMELIAEDEQERRLAQRQYRQTDSPRAGPDRPTGDSAKGAPGRDGTLGQPAAEELRPRVTEAPEINAVVIRASTAEHAQFAKIIEELDQPRDQVVLEVTLVVVRSDRTFDLGLELGVAALDGSGGETIGFTTFGIGSADPATGAIRIASPAPFGLNFALFNSADFSLVLNALQTVGDIRIKSAPKILVEDNAEATISQLNQEPFETTSQGESSTVTSFGGFVDAGVALTVVPHISERDWLRLNYDILLSSFGSRTAEQKAANLPPPRTQTMARGTVRIPAEHTVVLGGLVATRDDDREDSVPFLADIPVIGELFKNRSKANTNETLFIFIRPVLLRDAQFEDLIFLSKSDVLKAGLSDGEYPLNPLKLFDDVPPRGAR